MNMGTFEERSRRADKLIREWHRYPFITLNGWSEGWYGHNDKRASQSEASDTLCLVYSMVEVRMCAYQGRIAVIRNKALPRLIFVSEIPTYVDTEEPLFSSDGRYVFLGVFTKDFSGTLVIDVADNRYAAVRHPALSFCEVEEIDTETFRLMNRPGSNRVDIDRTIDMSSLKWFLIEKTKVDFITAFLDEGS